MLIEVAHLGMRSQHLEQFGVLLTTYPEEDRQGLICGHKYKFRRQLDGMSVYQITEVGLPLGSETLAVIGF